MDALSSSFITTFPTKKKLPTPPPTSKPNFTTIRTESKTTTTIPGAIINAFDGLINTFIDPPRRPSVDPRLVLSNNFAPVSTELPPTPCSLEHGSLPPCLLGGTYIRNGPNPQFLPRGPYHLFDGDGMLHALTLPHSDTTAPPSLCSRYVKTYKFSIEHAANQPLIPNVFSGFAGLLPAAARGGLAAARILSGQFNPANGIGLANTSLAIFSNRLFALGESDLPYEVALTKTGDLVTVGRHDFDGKLAFSMTAHPKFDAETNEAFAFRYAPVPPFLTFFRFDACGAKQPDVGIYSMRTPSFVHDFAVTKKYAVFSDMQIGMNPMEMLGGGGSMVAADTGKVPRIGVIPRYAKDEAEMRWFEAPGFNIVHAINAWDEDDGDAVVMVAPNILSIEHTLERMELIHGLVEKVRIDLKTGIVSRTPLSAANLDFGVVNPAYIAKKNRYIYAAVGDPMPKISGVVKLDVERAEIGGECTVAKRMFGPGCFGGEPFFVAKDDAIEEDDGYVLTYVHNEGTGESRFLVMDAKSPQLEVVASVKLPRRVPYGFHGLFVKESELERQSI